MREMMCTPEFLQVNWVEPPLQNALRTVVVGQAFASRLQRMFERQPFEPKLQLLGVFDSLAELAQAARHSAFSTADILLWQTGSLQLGVHQELLFAQEAWRAPAAAVLYRFSSASARAELTNGGAAVLDEPADDSSLRQWFASLQRTEAPQSQAADIRGQSPPFQGASMNKPLHPPCLTMLP